MKKMYLANDLIHAQLLVSMLEQSMIPARVENAHQAGGFGELAVTYPEVWIKRDADESRALEVIKTFDKKNSPIEAEQNCPKCDEINPAGFELCWACQADMENP